MNNPEVEPDILQSIDKSGYSEKQADLQIDKKGTVRQQVKQMNSPSSSQQVFSKKKKTQVIFQVEK